MSRDSSECQGSVRLHSFSARAFPQICRGDIGIETKFRKSYENGSLEFSFTENTIRRCKDFDFPEATLRFSTTSDNTSKRDGVMKKDASVVFDFGSMVIREASLKVQKALGGEEGSSLLQVRASWSPGSNSFKLHERFKIDSKNAISGSYDFRTDEAIFGYERTLSSSWKASASYNVQASYGEYTLDRTFEKADGGSREGVLSMVYCPEKENARISYDQGQWNTSFGLNTNSWVAGVLPIPCIDFINIKYVHLFTI